MQLFSFVPCFVVQLSGSVVLGNILNGCQHVEEYNGVILCDQDRRAYIMLGHCMTGDLIGGCPYVPQNASILNRVYYLLPTNVSEVNEDQCGPYHRKGLFCGECVSKFGPSVDFHSYHCLDCSNYSILNTIAYYLLSRVLPMTVFYTLIVLFRVNIVSSPFLGYVLFCQLCSFVLYYTPPLCKSFYHFINLH